MARLPTFATPGSRWKWRRDLVMSAAARRGVSRRVLADVFGLSRAGVQKALGRFDAARSGRAPDDATDPTPIRLRRDARQRSGRSGGQPP